MAYVERDGVKIWWDAEGEGEPVLLLMGLSSASTMWYRLVPHLTPNHRVILVDNRGAGRSDAPAGAYPVAAMAADALAVLDDAGEASAHIIGISLGSVIAQEMAVTAPGRVRSVVLVAANPGTTHGVYPPPDTLALVAAGATAEYMDFNEALVPVTYHPDTPRPRIDEDLQRRRQSAPTKEGVQGQILGVAGWDRYDELKSLDLPVLVLHGADDLLAPVENARILADAIPGAILQILAGASHQVFTDQEQAAADLITAWLARHRAN